MSRCSAIKTKFNAQTLTVTVCTAVAALFLLLLAYIYTFESNTVYNPRAASSYFKVDDYSISEIQDPEAPAGIRKIYTWTLGEITSGTDRLAFYLVHTYAEVRINGELVYSLSLGENNRIGTSVSSDWVLVPLYQSDSGSRVQVILTPVYKSVINRNVDFLIGSRSMILNDCRKQALPQIALSAMCIFVGLLMMATQLIISIKKKMSSRDIVFLGIFSVLIGIWRITDTRYSPILFSDNPMALGYITIGTLFVLPLPFLLFIKYQFTGKGEKILRSVIFLNCALSLSVLLCQYFGIADFRETLFIAHIVFILDIAAILGISVFYRQQIRRMRFWLLLALVVSGTVLDLVWYYVTGSSSGILFTIAALLVYIVIHFFEYLVNINRQADTDADTGLFNKRHWDDLMEKNKNFTEPIGIIMFDLNRLKYINDTLGHQAGDKMLLDFANILKKTIPSSAHICRWGGDEFTVMINGASRNMISNCLSSIRAATRAYNSTHEYPHIHFAAGYAVSSDFPDLSLKELFEKADLYMYRSKQQWYEANQTH